MIIKKSTLTVHTLGNNGRKELPLLHLKPQTFWHHMCKRLWSHSDLGRIEHHSFGAIWLVFRCWGTLAKGRWNAELVLCKESTGHHLLLERQVAVLVVVVVGIIKRDAWTGKRREKSKKMEEPEGGCYQGFGTWSLVPGFLSAQPREDLCAVSAV